MNPCLGPLSVAQSASGEAQLMGLRCQCVPEGEVPCWCRSDRGRFTEFATWIITAHYQTIVDIAPIAAPSNAGASLEGVYGNFTPVYPSAVEALALADGKIRPMAAPAAP
ncbi:hypothetical protein BRDID11002_59650 [Bradyrhizobium diazoefficiens]